MNWRVNGEIYHYPLGGHDIEGLPQIAQYLAVTRQGAYLRKELYRYVYGRILEKYPDDVPDRLKGLKSKDIHFTGELVSVVGQKSAPVTLSTRCEYWPAINSHFTSPPIPAIYWSMPSKNKARLRLYAS